MTKESNASLQKLVTDLQEESSASQDGLRSYEQQLAKQNETLQARSKSVEKDLETSRNQCEEKEKELGLTKANMDDLARQNDNLVAQIQRLEEAVTAKDHEITKLTATLSQL